MSMLLPGEPPHADDVAPRGTKEWRQAVDAHRDWVGNQLWTQQATSNLNLSDPQQMQRALASLGITNEVGGGRHAYNLFMPGGALASEGFGTSQVPGRDGMAYALEAYMPDWKFNLDRSIQSGTPRSEANAMFLPAGAPGSASYSGGGFSGGPTASASFAPSMSSGPSVAGLGSTEGAGGGVPMGYAADDTFKRARDMFMKGRERRTLGDMSSLGGY